MQQKIERKKKNANNKHSLMKFINLIKRAQSFFDVVGESWDVLSWNKP